MINRPAATLLLLLSGVASAQPNDPNDLPVMEQPAAAKPDESCAALGRLIKAAPGKFASVYGKKGTTPGVFQSTVVLPDMGCAVRSAADAASSAKVVCLKTLPGDETDVGVFRRKAEAIGSCLDPQAWELSKDLSDTVTFHNRVDTTAPEILVRLQAKGPPSFALFAKKREKTENELYVDLIAAPPVKLVDPAAFCKELEGFVKKAQTNFAGMRVDKSPLMGTASCTNSVSEAKGARLDCKIYEGDDRDIARSSFRYFSERVWACLPENQWTADIKQPALTSQQTALFENPSPQAPLILVQHTDNSLATPQQRKSIGITGHPVGVSIGLRPAMYKSAEDEE